MRHCYVHLAAWDAASRAYEQHAAWRCALPALSNIVSKQCARRPHLEGEALQLVVDEAGRLLLGKGHSHAFAVLVHPGAGAGACRHLAAVGVRCVPERRAAARSPGTHLKPSYGRAVGRVRTKTLTCERAMAPAACWRAWRAACLPCSGARCAAASQPVKRCQNAALARGLALQRLPLSFPVLGRGCRPLQRGLQGARERAATLRSRAKPEPGWDHSCDEGSLFNNVRARRDQERSQLVAAPADALPGRLHRFPTPLSLLVHWERYDHKRGCLLELLSAVPPASRHPNGLQHGHRARPTAACVWHYPNGTFMTLP